MDCAQVKIKVQLSSHKPDHQGFGTIDEPVDRLTRLRGSNPKTISSPHLNPVKGDKLRT